MNAAAILDVECFQTESTKEAKMKLVKRFTYKGELVTIQRDGFMQYYFELADGVQRFHPKLTASGAERQAKQVIDDMIGTIVQRVEYPPARNMIIDKPEGRPARRVMVGLVSTVLPSKSKVSVRIL
jgi:hypothetical protein